MSARRLYYGWTVLLVAAAAMVGTLPGRTQGLGLITESLLAELHIGRVEYAELNLWATLIDLKNEGKVIELGVALGPAIGWVEEGVRSIDDRPIVSLQTVFNALEQEPGRTFAQRPRVQHGEVSLISRVPSLGAVLYMKLAASTWPPPGMFFTTITGLPGI